MASIRPSTLNAVLFVLALSGVRLHAAESDCSAMDQATVMSKMVSCIGRKHPQDLLTILTKIPHPQQMESPDFMCSNQGLVVDMFECLMNYVEGCMPAPASSQLTSMLPTRPTIQKAVQFLCQHKQDFEEPCVVSHVSDLMQCFSTHLQTFSRATTYSAGDSKGPLCSALKMEADCLTSSLSSCPASVRSTLISALLHFFPSQHCSIQPLSKNSPLLFSPESQP